MSEPTEKSEIKKDETAPKEPPRRPKFPKIKTRVKAGGPWRRY